jgi:hypothetical protein
MRTRAYRRHQIHHHMMRRLREDRNQHYEDLSCPCWTDLKAMARFKEQSKLCSCWMCCNPRRVSKTKDALTIQERRFFCAKEAP